MKPFSAIRVFLPVLLNSLGDAFLGDPAGLPCLVHFRIKLFEQFMHLELLNDSSCSFQPMVRQLVQLSMNEGTKFSWIDDLDAGE